MTTKTEDQIRKDCLLAIGAKGAELQRNAFLITQDWVVSAPRHIKEHRKLLEELNDLVTEHMTRLHVDKAICRAEHTKRV